MNFDEIQAFLEVFGMVFAASNVARLLLPLRFGAALAMAPWVEENIMPRGPRINRIWMFFSARQAFNQGNEDPKVVVKVNEEPAAGAKEVESSDLRAPGPES